MKGKALRKAVAIVSVITLLISVLPMEQAQAAKKIKLNKSKITIKIGKSVTLKLKNAKKKVTWKSSNKKIASVDKKGKVTGKKAGSVKITAKSAGKKYICKVMVKKIQESSSPAPTTAINQTPSVSSTPAVTQTPGISQNPSGTATVKPSQTPAGTEKPVIEVTVSPEESQSPVGSETPEQTQNPATSNTPEQTQGPAASNTPVQTPAPSNPTGGISQVSLGMTTSELSTLLGTSYETIDTPQGYTGYVYNENNTFEKYMMVYVDNSKVVGIATMSKEYSYGEVVAIGDSASGLSGFKSMGSYDYEAGYLYETSTEYVMAFSDHQNDSKIYAIQIFAATDGEGNAVELDDLIKPENLTYNDSVNADMAYQMYEWVNAYRYFLGIPLVKYNSNSTAQSHSEDMAASGAVQQNSSDGTTWKDRFDANYKDILGLWEEDTLGKAENIGGRSPDAFGFIAWWIDDSDSTSRNNIIKDVSEDYYTYYLCTGFAYSATASDRTYATLDFFY